MSKPLTAGQLERARTLLSTGYSTREVASRMKVRRSSVSAILANMNRSSSNSTTSSRVSNSTPTRVYALMPELLVRANSASEARSHLTTVLGGSSDILVSEDSLSTRRASASSFTS